MKFDAFKGESHWENAGTTAVLYEQSEIIMLREYKGKALHRFTLKGNYKIVWNS